MAILFVGDTHTNLDWWTAHVVPVVRLHRPAAVVSVGDFGYWPSHPEGRRFLEEVGRTALAAGTSVLFVDGNHEQFDALPRLSGDAFTPVAPGVAHLSRGARWHWNGVRFGALGGAVSPDRAKRTKGWDWFPEEGTTAGDVARLGAEPLDVLVTHDAPTAVNLPIQLGLDADVARDAEGNRRLVDAAMAATRAAVVVHGHWHLAHRTRLSAPDGDVLVVGLAADSASNPVDALWLAEPADLVRRVGTSGKNGCTAP